MVDTSFDFTADDRRGATTDDIPKSLRRRDAASRTTVAERAEGVVMTGLAIPFWQLVFFFVKCAFAAIPAVLVLAFMVGVISQVATDAFPWLTQVKIQIYVPQ